MNISLIITIYNSPEFLKLVLDSVRLQLELPYEAVVVDDGSGKETIDLINKENLDFPSKLLHVRQENKGFRAAKSRINGIKVCSGN